MACCPECQSNAAKMKAHGVSSGDVRVDALAREVRVIGPADLRSFDGLAICEREGQTVFMHPKTLALMPLLERTTA